MDYTQYLLTLISCSVYVVSLVVITLDLLRPHKGLFIYVHVYLFIYFQIFQWAVLVYNLEVTVQTLHSLQKSH